MVNRKLRRRRIPEYQQALTWYEHASVERFTERAAIRYVLEGNLISAPYPRMCSSRKQLEVIASNASRPFPIHSISPSPRLDEAFNYRARGFHDAAAKYIDDIAGAFGMRWWITDDGLAVNCDVAEVDPSDFVAMAGQLTVERFLANGQLNDEDLLAIAKVLDEGRFSLLGNLQPSFRAQLGRFNIQHPRIAIKTFQQAIGHRHLGRRAVQKALYSAREKFLKSKNRVDAPGRAKWPGTGAYFYA